jgi:hypothetical protein
MIRTIHWRHAVGIKATVDLHGISGREEGGERASAGEVLCMIGFSGPAVGVKDSQQNC